jgi:hypothetical protein
MSWCHKRMKAVELAKTKNIREHKRFERKPGDDFDTWWVLVQVIMEDQPEEFPHHERTIDWIEFSIDWYDAA